MAGYDFNLEQGLEALSFWTAAPSSFPTNNNFLKAWFGALCLDAQVWGVFKILLSRIIEVEGKSEVI